MIYLAVSCAFRIDYNLWLFQTNLIQRKNIIVCSFSSDEISNLMMILFYENSKIYIFISYKIDFFQPQNYSFDVNIKFANTCIRIFFFPFKIDTIIYLCTLNLIIVATHRERRISCRTFLSSLFSILNGIRLFRWRISAAKVI